MKKSRLLEIIQEEIQNVLNEAEKETLNDKFLAALTRDGDVKLGGTGMGNIMRPKSIDIAFDDDNRYYKTTIDGKEIGKAETEDLIEKYTGMMIGLRMMDSKVLNQVKDKLKAKNIDLTFGN